MSSFKLILFTTLVISVFTEKLRLYPKESETREVKLLNGIWNFRVIPVEEDQKIGFTQKWYSQPLERVSHKFFNQIKHTKENTIAIQHKDWRRDSNARSLQF